MNCVNVLTSSHYREPPSTRPNSINRPTSTPSHMSLYGVNFITWLQCSWLFTERKEMALTSVRGCVYLYTKVVPRIATVTLLLSLSKNNNSIIIVFFTISLACCLWGRGLKSAPSHLSYDGNIILMEHSANGLNGLRVPSNCPPLATKPCTRLGFPVTRSSTIVPFHWWPCRPDGMNLSFSLSAFWFLAGLGTKEIYHSQWWIRTWPLINSCTWSWNTKSNKRRLKSRIAHFDLPLVRLQEKRTSFRFIVFYLSYRKKVSVSR